MKGALFSISLAGMSQFECDPNASLQVERLENPIQFFQIQLKSAALDARSQEATVQAHEKAIQLQDMVLEKVNASNVFLLARVDELEKEKAKKAKEEREFFGGIIKLGNWNTKGVIVNLPQLIDKVTEIMNADEIVSYSVQRELSSASQHPALSAGDEEKE